MIRTAAALAVLAGAASANPLLSIDITLGAGEPYEDAVAAAVDLGAKATSLSLMWDEQEASPGTLTAKDNWPVLANLYFPSTGLTYTLTFSVIDTTADRRPADLRGLAWDDPQVIQRFIAHADAVLTAMPRVQFASITVGNEVDVLLTDPGDIAAFARFLAAVRPAIADSRPDVPFGTKLTFAGLTDPAQRYAPLVAAGDGVFATYYPLAPGFRIRPLTDVPKDIAALAALSNGRGLWLMEAGYPSDGCDAPATGQADFVTALFAAARRTPDMRLVSYTFLTDLSDAELDRLTQYYGVGDDCFRRYLGSIGLRGNDLSEKPAAATFRKLARE